MQYQILFCSLEDDTEHGCKTFNSKKEASKFIEEKGLSTTSKWNVEIREVSEPITVQELNNKIAYDEHINIEETVYKGFKVKVGDLIYYETVCHDSYEGYQESCYSNYYGIVQSIVRHGDVDTFNIKTVAGENGYPKDREDEENEYFQEIVMVCTPEYFDALINRAKEDTDYKIKSLQKEIEETRLDGEKDIDQFERLKDMIK